ncbi:MAG: Verru_Chthon cassette protein A [Verrucomicrobiales bacterium]|nr:Verru_Chthon cassette protein A [Verrucomicrobiales bacterium]
MKLIHQARNTGPFRHRAAALVSTLMILSLATILMLAYMASSISELRSSAYYNDSTEVQILSERAVNLVLAQIRDATDDPDYLWVSQPGGIRQFDQSGNFVTGFKLYSDDWMVESESEAKFALEDAEELRSWANHPDQWVDLNEPVIRGDLAHFPIATPDAKLKRRVDGFDFTTSDVQPGPMGEAMGKLKSHTLPMPVRWLYVLESGALGTLDRSGKFVPVDGRPLSNSAHGPKDPIIGRIAFWADDESSKININTASEPTYWDTPRAGGPAPITRGRFRTNRDEEFDDRAYGWSQPTAEEYQRFPGHPSTTAVSPVLFPGLPEVLPDYKELIYELAPRISWGGSEGGTLAMRQIQELTLDRNYLYPTVDDYLLMASRELNSFEVEDRPRFRWPAQYDAFAQLPNTKVDPWIMLEQSRFFLTANSRAPEVNLFNKPRVSIWPTHVDAKSSDGTHRTVYDELIRFCARTGTKGVNEAEYFFQRRDADSPVADFETIPRNRDLFKYLQEMTSQRIPGYGGRFDAKFGEDRDQVLTQIFDYIRSTNLYDDNLPKLGYSEKDWLEKGKQDQFTDGRRGRWSRDSYPGHGQVVPIQIEKIETKGFGRFYTVSEAGIMFICCADAGGPHPQDPERPQYPLGLLGSNQPGQALGKNKALPRKLSWKEEEQERCLQAALLFEMFTPSQGWTQINEDMTMEVEVLKKFSVDGEPVDFELKDDVWQSTGDCYNGNSNSRRGGRIGNLGQATHTATWGGTIGFWSLTKERLAPRREPLPADRGVNGNKRNRSDDRRRVYPFISVPLVIKGDDEQMDFGGGRIRVNIYGGTNHSKDAMSLGERPLVQSIEIEFPGAKIPVPRLAQWRGPRSSGNPRRAEDGTWEYTLDRRFWTTRTGQKRYRTRPGGVFFPSYWWTFNRDGIGIGDPQHGHKNYSGWSVNRSDHSKETWRGWQQGRLLWFGRDTRMTFVQYQRGLRGADVVRTMVPWHGDYRLIAAKKEVPKEDFVPHRFYFEKDRYLAHHFTGTSSDVLRGSRGYDGGAAELVPEMRDNKNANYHGARKPDYPQTEDGLKWDMVGDFDNGISVVKDGAYINKPDEGNGRQWMRGRLQSSRQFTKDGMQIVKGDPIWSVPYFDAAAGQQMGGPAFFSPNRQISSPGMFGSLPTGVKRGLPWQTLLFRPQEDHPGGPKPDSGENRGSIHPPDHLMLDLFWMPVVEPYAVSEPFSTAGKINLNYRMLPFSHIKRATGLHGVLKSEELLGIPLQLSRNYKSPRIPDDRWDIRHPIDVEETLRQFEERFDQGQVFKTASEICEVHLVPDKGKDRSSRWEGKAGTADVTLEDMRDDYWEKHAMTGDNSRGVPTPICIRGLPPSRTPIVCIFAAN